MPTTWILGAPDPEMEEIEAVLSRAGQAIRHATLGGRRVAPPTAYRADGPGRLDGPFVLVECGGPALDRAAVHRCDHHRRGDPGYGLPPARFLEGSSLGQVAARLGLPLTPRQRLIAAADHCLSAAYAGQCPGVEPDDLARHRTYERASWLARGPGQGRDAPRADVARCFYGRSPAMLDAGEVGEGGLRDDTCDDWCPPHAHAAHHPQEGAVERWAGAIERAQAMTWKRLQATPRLTLGGAPVFDLRALGTLPELPEVLARYGRAALYRMVPPPEARDPRVKIGIIGGGEGTVPGAEPVREFLARLAGELGLVDPYGDPARGFAGGYEPR